MQSTDHQRTTVAQIKETIRTLRSANSEATKDKLFDALRRNTDDFEAVKKRYETLRKRGEIYSYPSGGVVVVKVTNDVL